MQLLKILPSKIPLPFFVSKIHAGYPSPADDYAEGELDIHDFLVRSKPSTFLLRVTGNSMRGAGILEGDYIVVDKSVQPVSGSMVVASINGEYAVKTFRKGKNNGWLLAENPNYPPIEVSAESDFQVWGVVVGQFRRLGDHVRAG